MALQYKFICDRLTDIQFDICVKKTWSYVTLHSPHVRARLSDVQFDYCLKTYPVITLEHVQFLDELILERISPHDERK
jgi:hypothetical protein